MSTENPYAYDKGYQRPVVWTVIHWTLDEDEELEMQRAPVAAFSQDEAFAAAEKAGLSVDHPHLKDETGLPLRIIDSTPTPVLVGKKVRKHLKKGKL